MKPSARHLLVALIFCGPWLPCAAGHAQLRQSAPLSAATRKLTLAEHKIKQQINIQLSLPLVAEAPQTIAANASSGLPVTLSSLNPQVCSLQNNQLLALQAGNCVVAAMQNGNAAYAPVIKRKTFKAVKNRQIINPTALPLLMAGQSVSFSLTASSGLGAQLNNATPHICRINGGVLHAFTAGICLINARQSGNSAYLPAPEIQLSGDVLPAHLNTGYGTVVSFLAAYQNGELTPGDYQVGFRIYSYDGRQLLPRNGLWAGIVGKRPKVAAFGDSIIALGDQMPLWNNPIWSPSYYYYPTANGTGYINWFLALTNDAFDWANANQQDFGIQAANNPNHAELDSLGVYSYAGANMSNLPAANGSMWPNLPEVLQSYKSAPDIIFLSNLYENDLGAAGFSAEQLKNQTLNWLNAIRAVYPNAGIILDTPNPSLDYALAGNTSAYYDLAAWLLTLPDQYDWLYVDANFCCSPTPGVANPTPDLSMLRANDGVHPVERGALKRAWFRWKQLGFLFPNSLNIAAGGYNPANNDNTYYQQNPAFTQTAPPAVPLHGALYTDYEFLLNDNFDALISPPGDQQGIIASLYRTGHGTAAGVLTIANDQGATPAITETDTFVQAVKLKVLSPAHLYMLGMETVFTNFRGNFAHVLSYNTNTPNYTKGYNGIADIIPAGAELTLVSKPFSPIRFLNISGLDGIYYTRVYITADAATPVSADAGPQVQIIAQNLIKIPPLP